MPFVLKDVFNVNPAQTSSGPLLITAITPPASIAPTSNILGPMLRRIGSTGAGPITVGTSSLSATLNLFEQGFIKYDGNTGSDFFDFSSSQKLLINNIGVSLLVTVFIRTFSASSYTIATTVAPGANEILFSDPGWSPPIVIANLLNVKSILVTINNGDTPTTYTLSMIAADPHVLCLDGTRLDVYAPGFYRYYDNGATDPKRRVVANVEVREDDLGQDYAAALWVWSEATGPTTLSFGDSSGGVSLFDPHHGAEIAFVLEGAHNTVGMKCAWPCDVVNVGGLMAGRVCAVTSLDDTTTAAPMRKMMLARNGTPHALLCGSGDPHAVAFSGARAEVPRAEEVLVLGKGPTRVWARFDGNGHLVHMRAFDKLGECFSAHWDGLTRNQADSRVRVAGRCLIGEPRCELGATGVAEALVGGSLFVRVQPGGVASFKELATLGGASSSGLLAKALSRDVRRAEAVECMYANAMEPHLLFATA